MPTKVSSSDRNSRLTIRPKSPAGQTSDRVGAREEQPLLTGDERRIKVELLPKNKGLVRLQRRDWEERNIAARRRYEESISDTRRLMEDQDKLWNEMVAAHERAIAPYRQRAIEAAKRRFDEMVTDYERTIEPHQQQKYERLRAEVLKAPKRR